MSICNDIEDEMMEFRVRTGHSPKVIYLGLNTRDELLSEVFSVNNHVQVVNNGRIKFNSLPVYIVDTEEHIGVS